MTDIDQIPRGASEAARFALEKICSADSKIFGYDYDDETRVIAPGKMVELLSYLRVTASALNRLGLSSKYKSHIDNIGKAAQKGDVQEIQFQASTVLSGLITSSIDQHILAETESDAYTFELDSSEIKRVHNLLSEIRRLIKSTNELEDEHRLRILKRVGLIEAELYKPKGSFDAVLAGVVEFGEALGSAGEKIKPAIDRMSEVRKIISPRVNVAEQIGVDEKPRSLPKPNGEEIE